MTDGQLTVLAKAALSRDHEPVPWDSAPEWRRAAMAAVARAAIGACGMGRADHAFSAWLLSMTTLGWRWGHVFSEAERTHPGIITFQGGLNAGDTRHWNGVVDAVRDTARVLGVRVTE